MAPRLEDGLRALWGQPRVYIKHGGGQRPALGLGPGHYIMIPCHV